MEDFRVASLRARSRRDTVDPSYGGDEFESRHFLDFFLHDLVPLLSLWVVQDAPPPPNFEYIERKGVNDQLGLQFTVICFKPAGPLN